jgi:two-component system, NarL family, nitrate/nitrite response regulator NarL
MPPVDSPPIRVMLIDDHRSVLWGLEKLIDSGKPAMEVVGTATTRAEALALLDKALPDVILLDMDLGNESGLDVIPDLLARSRANILILTGLRDQSVHDSAVLAGARGVVLKEDSAETILTAIRKVHLGQLWLDPTSTGRIFVKLSRKGPQEAPDPEKKKIAALTAREREIVAAIATNAGATASKVADALHITEHTLRNHLTSIYDKLGVANRLELFAYAHKHGLTDRIG